MRLHQKPSQYDTGIIGNHGCAGHPAHIPAKPLNKQDIKDDVDRIQDHLKDKHCPAVAHRQQPAKHTVLHQGRRRCPDPNGKVIACGCLNRRAWCDQRHGQFNDRILQHHDRKTGHYRDKGRTGKNRTHPIGITPPMGLCGKACGRHAQEPEPPKHIGKDQRPNRNCPDIMRAIKMTDDSSIDSTEQRDGGIGQDNRQGQRQNTSIPLA